MATCKHAVLIKDPDSYKYICKECNSVFETALGMPPIQRYLEDAQRYLDMSGNDYGAALIAIRKLLQATKLIVQESQAK